MNEELQFILDSTKEAMQAAIEHLDKQLQKIRAGKASPMMLSGVMVDYYGAKTPLAQVANVNTLDGRTITVQAWEKNMIGPIEKAIIDSNLGLNPQNNGEQIMINVPMLTEERRRDLCKQARAEGEHAKVGIRNARKDANDEVKKMQKDGLSEDVAKGAEADVQKLTDNHIAKVDTLIEAKEKDIMTV